MRAARSPCESGPGRRLTRRWRSIRVQRPHRRQVRPPRRHLLQLLHRPQLHHQRRPPPPLHHRHRPLRRLQLLLRHRAQHLVQHHRRVPLQRLPQRLVQRLRPPRHQRLHQRLLRHLRQPRLREISCVGATRRLGEARSRLGQHPSLFLSVLLSRSTSCRPRPHPWRSKEPYGPVDPFRPGSRFMETSSSEGRVSWTTVDRMIV